MLPLRILIVGVALFNATVKDPETAGLKLLSPACVAVSEQVPVASDTDTAVAVTEQPVELPVLKVSAPVPPPPDAVAVPVVPKVTDVGAVTASVVWSAFAAATETCFRLAAL